MTTSDDNFVHPGQIDHMTSEPHNKRAMEHLCDEDLVAHAKLGSEQALTELWNRHGGRVRSVVMRIIRNREDVEDVLQETYLKSFLHLISFNGDSKFSTWLVSIAINMALMLLRKRKRSREVFYEGSESDAPLFAMNYPDRSESLESLYSRWECSQYLWIAIQQLPPHLKYVVELQNRDEVPLAEIAHRTGSSVGAVKARLVRARAALKDLTSHSRIREAPQPSHRWSKQPKRHAPSAYQEERLGPCGH